MLRDALTELFVARATLGEPDACVMAAGASALPSTASEEWQRRDGQRPLAELITETFDVLGVGS